MKAPGGKVKLAIDLAVVALCAAAIVLFFFVAGATARSSWATHDSLQASACGVPLVRLSRPVPAEAVIDRADAYVNGHALHGWKEAPLTAGLGGYGVIVQIAFSRLAGPATIRIGSALKACRKVRVVLTWHVDKHSPAAARGAWPSTRRKFWACPEGQDGYPVTRPWGVCILDFEDR